MTDLDDIASLTAARHARSLAAERLLNPAFGDPTHVRQLLPEEPQGWVAERDGQVIAAMLWHDDHGRAFCPLAASVGDAEAFTQIYAVAAGEWVAAGYTTHAVTVPSVDRPLGDRLVDLSFGRQQAYAVRPLGDHGGEKLDPGDVVVERVGVEALEDVVRLGNLLALHHEGSPVFDRRSDDFFSGLPEAYQQLIDVQGAGVVVARIDDEPVGVLIWEPRSPRPIYAPDSAEMVLLAVHPKARGRRVGRVLISTGIRDMAFNGHSSAVADWRTTNLEAARFWPAQGFLTVAHRYVREIPTRPHGGLDD